MLRNRRKLEIELPAGMQIDPMTRIHKQESTGFVIHQVSSTLGVAMLSGISFYQTLELFRLAGINFTTPAATSLLLGLPGFPFQAIVALGLGFGLARYVRVRSVLYVWIAPLLFFCFGVLNVAPNSSRLDFLIGEGCKATKGCFYQVLFTLPLTGSVSYTIGAILSSSVYRGASPR